MMRRRIVALWMTSFSHLDVVFEARQVHDPIRIELVAVSDAEVRGQADASSELTNLGDASSAPVMFPHVVTAMLPARSVTRTVMFPPGAANCNLQRCFERAQVCAGLNMLSQWKDFNARIQCHFGPVAVKALVLQRRSRAQWGLRAVNMHLQQWTGNIIVQVHY